MLPSHGFNIFLSAIVSVFVIIPVLTEADSKVQSPPFSAHPFKAPADLKEIHRSYRSSWRRLTGFELSGLHWNQFVLVYTNNGSAAYRKNYYEYIRAYEAEEEDEEYETQYKTYPVGAVILKENYSSSAGRPGEPITMTTMIKRGDGFDPENGNWEYIESDPNGNVILRGSSSDDIVNARCVSCHVNIKERDYIFSTFFTNVSAH